MEMELSCRVLTPKMKTLLRKIIGVTSTVGNGHC